MIIEAPLWHNSNKALPGQPVRWSSTATAKKSNISLQKKKGALLPLDGNHNFGLVNWGSTPRASTCLLHVVLTHVFYQFVLFDIACACSQIPIPY
jgi:hypothetical protein